MIVGLGLDLTEISRIAALLDRWGDRFARRVFTEREREFANRRAEPARHLAARFAAKEAALKALAVPAGLRWHEMEVTGGGDRPPALELSGRAREAADRLGIVRVHITLSHDGDIAAAVVIAEGEDR